MKIIVSRKRVFWYYKLLAKNGEVVATSETYYSKSNALRAAQTLADCLGIQHELS